MATTLHPDTHNIPPLSSNLVTLTLHDTIVIQLHQILPYGKKWDPDKHTTVIDSQLYIKIKSHQLRFNGYPKYNTQQQP